MRECKVIFSRTLGIKGGYNLSKWRSAEKTIIFTILDKFIWYTHYEVVLGISGPVWSWNVRTRLPEILIFRLNKTIGLVMLRLKGTEHLYL